MRGISQYWPPRMLLSLPSIGIPWASHEHRPHTQEHRACMAGGKSNASFLGSNSYCTTSHQWREAAEAFRTSQEQGGEISTDGG